MTTTAKINPIIQHCAGNVAVTFWWVLVANEIKLVSIEHDFCNF